MSVKIECIDPDYYIVNGTPILKDMDGEWLAKGKLTDKEARVFKQHLMKQKMSFKARKN